MIDADGIAAFLPADPVPPQVLACAASAFGRRTAGAVPALECLDSVLLPTDGVRAGAALPRLIGFECETLAVELQIIDEAEGRVIVGQLLPARAGVVYVRPKPIVHVVHRRGGEHEEGEGEDERDD